MRTYLPAALILLSTTALLGAGEPQVIGPDRSKQLLLDPRIVQSTTNAKLSLGTIEKEPRNPLIRADQPWENALNNLYPNVLWDAGERVFKLWYKCVLTDKEVIAKMANPTTVHDQGWFLLYATSRDGLAWEKPAIGQFEFDGARTNNAVARDTPNVGVFRDPHDPDPARRFKMVYDVGLGKPRTRTSPDGIRWSEPAEPRGFLGYHGDTHNNAFWDERSQRYVWFTKAYLGERLVARLESPDFVHWTPTGVVLRSSIAEGRAHQTYCLPVFPYANGYLGYLMMYHVGVDRAVDCELAWSPDSIHWQRVAPGVPFIPRGEKGSYDGACIYAPSGPAIAQDGRLLIYYGGDFFPHQGWKRHCLPSLARLRVDGFAGYAAEQAGVATVVTQPVLITGTLAISADARGGRVRCTILDDPEFGGAASDPIVQDVTDGPVTWTGRDGESLRGRVVRLQFELQGAKLYAFRGAELIDKPVSDTAVRHFENTLDVGFAKAPPAGAEIRFTTDGSAPSIKSPVTRESIAFGKTTRLRARVFLPGSANGGPEFDEVFVRRTASRQVPLPAAAAFSFDENTAGWVGTDAVEQMPSGGVNGGHLRATRAGGRRAIASLPQNAVGGLAGNWPKRLGGDGATIAFHTRADRDGACQFEIFAGDVAQWTYRKLPKLTNEWQRGAAVVRWDWNDAEAEAAGWAPSASGFSWRETMAQVGKLTFAIGTAGTATGFDLDEFSITPFRDEEAPR